MDRPAFNDLLSDGQPKDGLRLQFELNLLRGERTRATLLAGFFAIVAVLLAARLVVVLLSASDPATTLREVGVPLAVSIAFLGFEVLVRRFLTQRIAEEEPVPMALWYLTTLIEMIALGAALYFPLRFGVGTTATGFEPQVVILLVFIGLSATRLRFSIAAFTGLLAALCYLLLAFALVPAPVGAEAMVGRLPEGYFWVAGLILGSGLIAGYVARQLRHQTLGLVRAVAKSQRLEREVARAADDERYRIGRDLHDGLGSHLTGIAMLCRGLVRRVGKGEAVREQEMEAVAEGVESGVEQARRLARGLSPVDLSDRDLAHVLGELAARTETTTDLSCTLDVRGPVPDHAKALDLDTATHLYRIAQEAVTNAVKHAHPTRIALTLAAEDGRLLLTVEDDGCGLPSCPDEQRGLGLRTMRYRAALIGADLTVEEASDGGTRVRCLLPSTAVE